MIARQVHRPIRADPFAQVWEPVDLQSSMDGWMAYVVSRLPEAIGYVVWQSPGGDYPVLLHLRKLWCYPVLGTLSQMWHLPESQAK
jgi:hypothetical protein